jgi:hypothetical protein
MNNRNEYDILAFKANFIVENVHTENAYYLEHGYSGHGQSKGEGEGEGGREREREPERERERERQEERNVQSL